MTYKRDIKLWLWIMAGLLVLAAPAFAAGDKEAPKRKPNRLDSYVETPYYKKKLFKAATDLAITKYSCPKPGFEIKRKNLTVLEPVSFPKKITHPIKGVWFENTDVILCGQVAHIMVTVLAYKNKAPDFAAEFIQKDVRSTK